MFYSDQKNCVKTLCLLLMELLSLNRHKQTNKLFNLNAPNKVPTNQLLLCYSTLHGIVLVLCQESW